MAGILSDKVMPWDDYADTTMGRARQMLEHPSGTFLEARKRMLENKATAAKGIELNEDQRSKKGKIRLASIVAGLFAKNPGVGLLNAYGATEQYENRQKYNNYLDNRLAMHGISKTEKAGLMARRLNEESFSSTSPRSSASRRSYTSKFVPKAGSPGREQLMRFDSATGLLSPVEGLEGEIPERQRMSLMGYSEERAGGNLKAKIDGARAQWYAMSAERKANFIRKVKKGSLRQSADRELFNSLTGSYPGMDPDDLERILVELFGEEEADSSGMAAPDLGDQVDALTEKMLQERPTGQ